MWVNCENGYLNSRHIVRLFVRKSESWQVIATTVNREVVKVKEFESESDAYGYLSNLIDELCLEEGTCE